MPEMLKSNYSIFFIPGFIIMPDVHREKNIKLQLKRIILAESDSNPFV
jgi:hypothetical protein